MEQNLEQFVAEEQKNLSAFIYRMTNDLDQTADLVQNTLLTAHEKGAQFKGDSSFKTWVFSIASRKALDFLRKEKRWADNVMDKAKAAAMEEPEIIHKLASITQQSPHGQFEVKEHIELCFRCISKSLPIEQQLAIMLKDIFEFTVKEVACITDRTESQIKHYLEDGRANMMDVFDKRCALINKKGICHQCSELNGIFNPKQAFQEKKVQIAFANDAESKTKEELYWLRNDLVKSIDPLESEGHEFQHEHMRFINKTAAN